MKNIEYNPVMTTKNKIMNTGIIIGVLIVSLLWIFLGGFKKK